MGSNRLVRADKLLLLEKRFKKSLEKAELAVPPASNEPKYSEKKLLKEARKFDYLGARIKKREKIQEKKVCILK